MPYRGIDVLVHLLTVIAVPQAMSLLSDKYNKKCINKGSHVSSDSEKAHQTNLANESHKIEGLSECCRKPGSKKY